MLFLGYSPNKNLSPSTLLRNILIVSSVISYTLYEFLSSPLSLLEDNDPGINKQSIIHFQIFGTCLCPASTKSTSWSVNVLRTSPASVNTLRSLPVFGIGIT